MEAINYFYRGILPHWQPPEATFFITYRLFGSVPKVVIQSLREIYEMALKEIQNEHQADFGAIMSQLTLKERRKIEAILKKKRREEEWLHFNRFDDFLDSNLNEPHWLRQPALAQLNADSIHFNANRYFKLWAFCIMSNHIHLLLTMEQKAPIRWKVMQDMKKYTGREGNKLIGKKGQFLEKESYDHLVRDGRFNRILAYILDNPVKAGLVKHWQDWPWTYCGPELLEGEHLG
ncbi:MAG: transposase [Phaeodactylibacter sp.]|nr:transposase [Phaeodactylibacter sp.]MCB0568316.1 transposase [Phaeodactylibacter sp.]MCB9299898.1 transposase [Lewinellaceae bacterium]